MNIQQPHASTSGEPETSMHVLTRSQSVAWLTLGLALTVLAITVGSGTFHLRLHLREHLAERDGDVLATVALARQYANGSGSNLTQRLRNPADQLALALEISQIREGVLGVRLFDSDGRFETAFPLTLSTTNLPAEDLSPLRALRPISRFHERANLADYFLLESNPALKDRIPLLEVNIPLYARGDSNLVAAAQLLLDGRVIAREYARVDEHLWFLGLGLYLVGAALLTGVLVWAYHRLRKAHAVVEERTARLLRANHDLALAAKTSALGSVTAHLVHGLSNPLANLQDFISSRGKGAQNYDFAALAESTRRMQQLVADAVRMIGEERGGDHYQITLGELADVLKEKLRTAARVSGVHLLTSLEAEGSLSNRHANLILLILENLIHNALKVTPPTGSVHLRIITQDAGACCEIHDEGPGISPQVVPKLFTPCRSTNGGSGIGLAISNQLANQLGAELRLKVNSPDGCVFALALPARLFAEVEPENVELGEEPILNSPYAQHG
jgi:signal transduction histidine kinase